MLPLIMTVLMIFVLPGDIKDTTELARADKAKDPFELGQKEYKAGFYAWYKDDKSSPEAECRGNAGKTGKWLPPSQFR